MKNNFLNIYNNLIKLTRNKILYENMSNNESFSDRLIIFFLHFAFFLKLFKNQTSKKNLQNLYDYVFRQIELSIREIGYGDASINKKMKEYVNLLFSIIDKINNWEDLDNVKKREILNVYIGEILNSEKFVDYLEKYRKFLLKNTFNNLSKDIITL